MDEDIEIAPDLPIIPPIEVNVLVNEAPIILNCDDKNDVEDDTPKTISDYKAEMIKDGLVDSDVEYFTKAYKNIEEVKFTKIHCTGCDKHMGSAPNEMDSRYQHPILKVLLCAKCFQFYCSGEFEKGEDGSELYCRWCGEGGLVYCCTKCPFVFCKNCITRNLGRGTARIIENTEYWICFSCNPWQISRHRATYWAIQKWSTEMLKKSKISGNAMNLEADANICCQGKKRAEPCEKSRVPQAKKQKIMKLDSSLLENALQNTASTSKAKKPANPVNLWQSLPLANLGPEDEVICTPDIIPIDESPPGSPLLSTPPPLIPYIMQQQSVSKIQPKQTQLFGKGKVVPINIKNLQKSVQNTFQKHVYPPSARIVANRAVNLGMLNHQDGLRIVHLPAPTSPAIKINDAETGGDTENDWFDKAIIECAEVTEYVSTKISGLAGVHSRAHKSERLMQELHNTLQTYIHVAIDKMRRIKRNMRENYDKEINKSEKMMNPFAKTKHLDDSSSQGTQSASEDDVYLAKEDDYFTPDTDSTGNSSKAKRKRKSGNVPVQQSTKIQRVPVVDDDDVIFDMDVTNASDEEVESRTTSSICSEAPFQTEEVINIISSDDDDSDIEEVFISAEETNITTEIKENDVEDDINKEEDTTNTTIKEQDTTVKEQDTTIKEQDTTIKEQDTTNKEVENTIKQTDKKDSINELVKNVEKKFNIQEISSKDLLNYLSAQVILYNNRRAQKAFAKVATMETKIKQNFDVIETIEDILNTEWEPNTVNEENNVEMEEPCDVEEMLGSSVVLRAKKSFGDEFSRFIDKSSESVPSGDEVSENDDNISNNVDVNDDAEGDVNDDTKEDDAKEGDVNDDAKEGDVNDANEGNVNDANEGNKDDTVTDESNIDNVTDKNDKMSDDSELDEAELFFNKDNESLSLPPDGIGDSISTNMFVKKDTENSDLVLDSGILALKQMAENCVNSTVELRQASTECNG